MLFLLVFYLQGARGYDPVTAGLMLAPLALGLLVLSPISGALADRIGSRFLATLGMVVTAVGLLGSDDASRSTPRTGSSRLWQLDHRRRLRPVHLAEHERGDGRRPAARSAVWARAPG